MKKPTIAGTVSLILVTASSLVPGLDRTARAESKNGSEARSSEDSRAAIQRALPYIARQTGPWIEQKKCTSCHQVPHALWAMNGARTAGFAVDDRLSEWNRWSVTFASRDTGETGLKPSARADEIGQMLLAGSLADVKAHAGGEEEPATARKRLISLLHAGQEKTAAWIAGGQLPGQKRSNKETNDATTMWSLLAMRSDGAEYKVARDRALATVESTSTSLEHLVLRYIHSLDAAGSEQVTALRSQILSHQNGDGGWGWLLEDKSDALATGQALYALSHTDEDVPRHAVRRAQEFLVRTQQSDGSWRVPSTLKEKEGEPYVISNDWGTAWAVIGLLRTTQQDSTASTYRP